MTEEALEKEAKQSYLDNTVEMQWDEKGEFDYTRGYINAAEPREKQIEELDKQIDTMLEDCKRCTYRKTSEQLEQAKKIIEELHEIVANKVEYKSTILMWNTMARAEKLLKEIRND